MPNDDRLFWGMPPYRDGIIVARFSLSQGEGLWRSASPAGGAEALFIMPFPPQGDCSGIAEASFSRSSPSSSPSMIEQTVQCDGSFLSIGEHFRQGSHQSLESTSS